MTQRELKNFTSIDKTPRLHKRIYLFLKRMYFILDKEICTEEIQKEAYKEYQDLILLGLRNNQEDFSKEFYKVALAMVNNLVDLETKTEFSFIRLNSEKLKDLFLSFLDELIMNAIVEFDGPGGFKPTVTYYQELFLQSGETEYKLLQDDISNISIKDTI